MVPSKKHAECASVLKSYDGTVEDLKGQTHFVGASCSSISPLMNVARLPAAADDSSAVFAMLRVLSSSSSVFEDF